MQPTKPVDVVALDIKGIFEANAKRKYKPTNLPPLAINVARPKQP